MEDFNQAININPHSEKAYQNRGNARNLLGDYQGGIEDFNQSININPDNEDAYYTRGVFLMQLGERQEGMKDIRRATKLAQQQGNTILYQKIQEVIRILQFS